MRALLLFSDYMVLKGDPGSVLAQGQCLESLTRSYFRRVEAARQRYDGYLTLQPSVVGGRTLTPPATSLSCSLERSLRVSFFNVSFFFMFVFPYPAQSLMPNKEDWEQSRCHLLAI
jgi:hypothetical protein